MGTNKISIENAPSSDTGYLQLSGVTKDFGTFRALENVNLTIAEGEFICFLGPSGCGKTTLLRCIAGLETQTHGTIFMGGKDISWLPPSQRDFGIVFQSYALFPNLTVADNVSYGLTNMKMSRSDINSRVTELLDLVGLNEHASKYPSQLSGGEQQRIALVRALATSPGLLLLDEPLSALDAKVRTYLRREIRSIQDRLGVTTIMVTHDQEEAQTMADRIFVMNQGRIEQAGTPDQIYEEPSTPFVADFIGVMNFFPGIVIDKGHVTCSGLTLSCDASAHEVGRQVNCAVRPEEILLVNGASPNENVLNAIIIDTEYLGSFLRLYLKVPELGVYELRVDIRKDVVSQHSLSEGSNLSLQVPKQSIRVFDVEPSP